MAKEDSHKGSVSDLDLVRVREKCSLRLPPCEHTMKTTSVCKPGRNLTGWHLDFGLPYTKTVKKKKVWCLRQPLQRFVKASHQMLIQWKYWCQRMCKDTSWGSRENCGARILKFSDPGSLANVFCMEILDKKKLKSWNWQNARKCLH